MLLQFLPSSFGVILRFLYGLAQGGVTTGDQTVEHCRRYAEGGWQLRGIEHAEAPAGACSHVEDATTLFHAGYNLFYECFYLRNGFLNSESHFLVFMIDVHQQFVDTLFLEVIVKRWLLCYLDEWFTHIKKLTNL